MLSWYPSTGEEKYIVSNRKCEPTGTRPGTFFGINGIRLRSSNLFSQYIQTSSAVWLGISNWWRPGKRLRWSCNVYLTPNLYVVLYLVFTVSDTHTHKQRVSGSIVTNQGATSSFPLRSTQCIDLSLCSVNPCHSNGPCRRENESWVAT